MNLLETSLTMYALITTNVLAPSVKNFQFKMVCLRCNVVVVLCDYLFCQAAGLMPSVLQHSIIASFTIFNLYPLCFNLCCKIIIKKLQSRVLDDIVNNVYSVPCHSSVCRTWRVFSRWRVKRLWYNYRHTNHIIILRYMTILCNFVVQLYVGFSSNTTPSSNNS